MYHLFTLVIHLSARLLIQSCILIVHPLAAASSYLNSMPVTAPDCLCAVWLRRLSRLSLRLHFRVKLQLFWRKWECFFRPLSGVTALSFLKWHMERGFYSERCGRKWKRFGRNEGEKKSWNIYIYISISSTLSFIPISSYFIWCPKHKTAAIYLSID